MTSPRSHWRSARLWAPVAAAACVGALVAGILIGRNGGDHTPPATHTPSPLPTTQAPTSTIPTSPAPTTGTTSTSVSEPVVTTTCMTTLPQGWTSALANSALDSGSATPATTTMTVLGLKADGGVIAARDDGPFPGYGREVVLLEPGRAASVLYSLSDPDRYNISSADISGNWLVVGVENQARQPKGTIGGNTPDVIDAIVAVNLTTHQTKVIASSPDYLKPGVALDSGIAIVNDVVFDGRVYWDQRPSYTATTGAVKSYDLGSGTTSTVASNLSGYLVAQAAGLVINPETDATTIIPATLPPTVNAALSAFSRARLNTDGLAYAWAVDPQTIGWWKPGEASPRYVKIAGGFETDDGGGAPLVAGDFVLTAQAEGQLLTDITTKASAPIPASAYKPLVRPYLYYSSPGYLAGGATSGTAGHYVNGYWLDSPQQVLRVKTATLPELSC